MTPILQTGERLLWQGSPGWRAIARDVLHIRWVLAYLGAQAAIGMAMATLEPGLSGVSQIAKLAVVSATGIALLALLAWLTARSTRMTITSARIVLTYGIAMPATLEIPFAAIEHIGLRIAPDHGGDIAIRMRPGQRVSYLKLWPFARPWHWSRPEPMLRSVPYAALVGGQLKRALDQARAIRAEPPNAASSRAAA